MAVVVSVNVGLPRDVEWQGKTVRTAIWKRHAPGRVFAGRLNLVGDAQGDLRGHGGEQRALMVYQLDSYRYWEKYLQRSDFVYGQFGENLTVEGLADAEVCIGDRFRIRRRRLRSDPASCHLLQAGATPEPSRDARPRGVPSAAGILSPRHRGRRDRRGGSDRENRRWPRAHDGRGDRRPSLHGPSPRRSAAKSLENPRIEPWLAGLDESPARRRRARPAGRERRTLAGPRRSAFMARFPSTESDRVHRGE